MKKKMKQILKIKILNLYKYKKNNSLQEGFIQGTQELVAFIA